MAVDNKYGKVSLEDSRIESDEPVVVFRAKDQLLPAVLRIYMELCEVSGSPPEHLGQIDDTHRKIVEWQMANPSSVKVPD